MNRISIAVAIAALGALFVPPVAAELPSTMLAAVATGRGKKVGDWSKIKVEERAVPKPGNGQVLIRVVASAVNPIDWKLYSSFVMSIMTLFGPKVLGFDVSGVVAEVGSGCSRLKVGDAVWALNMGTWADFTVADESHVGLKPSGMSFSHAGSMPLAGLTVFQSFRKMGLPSERKGFSIVVTSGAGGTGLPALQMAKAFGAKRIITASSPKNFELLKSLGATDVVDYHKATIWDSLEDNSVDYVLDNLDAPGTADLAMRVLKPGGIFLYIPGDGGGRATHPKEGVKEINFGLTNGSKYQDLDALKSLVDDGHLKAVVDESFLLQDITKAMEASSEGHAIGKIGVNVSSALGSGSTIFV